MAQIPNTNAFTVSDGQNTYLNVDTLNKIVQITNAQIATAQSATAAVIASAGTINTAGLGVSRVAPAAVTGVVLQVGTTPGQEVWVVNESAAASSVTFAASGTSNVEDGVSDVIAGLTARKFVWDSAQSLWFRAG
jgi:hypothetical protein